VNILFPFFINFVSAVLLEIIKFFSLPENESGIFQTFGNGFIRSLCERIKPQFIFTI